MQLYRVDVCDWPICISISTFICVLCARTCTCAYFVCEYVFVFVRAGFRARLLYATSHPPTPPQGVVGIVHELAGKGLLARNIDNPYVFAYQDGPAR